MKSTSACILFTLLCAVYGAEEATFIFTDGEFTILEKLVLEINIPYTTMSNETKSVPVTLPQNAMVVTDASSANKKLAILVVSFGVLDVNNLTQTFTVTDKEFEMTSISIGITFDNATFPDAADEGVTLEFTKLKLFKTKLGMSYSCNSTITVKEELENEAEGVTLMFSNMQLQPFEVVKATFSKASICPEDLPTTTPAGDTNLTTALTTAFTTASTTTKSPPPPPQDNNQFNLTVGNQTCILDNLDAQFTVTDGKAKHIFVLANATVDMKGSSCGKADGKDAKDAVLKVVFGDKNVDYFIQEFSVDNKFFYLKRMLLSLTAGKAAYKFNVTMTKNDTFRTPLKKYWHCDSNLTINHKDKSNTSLTVSFAKVKLQPFEITKSNFSKDVYDCPEDGAISNIVPIAVGCALAVLVIIVLIAYLIGRRNSSRSGYESV